MTDVVFVASQFHVHRTDGGCPKPAAGKLYGRHETELPMRTESVFIVGVWCGVLVFSHLVGVR